ncbi:MAG: hypothetical protein ACXVIG_04885 [Halobacteriota archaeon]
MRNRGVPILKKGGDLTIDAVTDDHTVTITVHDTGEDVAGI